MATATANRLEAVGSHSVSFEYGRGGEIVKEECYPVVRAEWRGREYSVTMSASRSVGHDGTARTWSSWNVYTYDVCEPREPGANYSASVHYTDTARAALRAACEPVVREWLDTDEYAASRQRAVAYALRRLIRDETVSADGPRENVERHSAAIDPRELENLRAACDSLDDVLTRTYGTPEPR